jgi:hypothetical protein
MLSAIDSRTRSQVILSLFQFTVDLPQIIERAMRTDPRGGGRDVEHARDVVVLEIVISSKDEHRSLLRLETHHRLLEQCVSLADRICVLMVLVGFDGHVGYRFVSSLLTPMLVTHVVRNAIQPGREGGVAAEGVAIPQDAEKRLLREIVGRIGTPRQPITQRVHSCVVSLEEHAELVDVALADGAHYRFVGCVGHARRPRFSASFLL